MKRRATMMVWLLPAMLYLLSCSYDNRSVPQASETVKSAPVISGQVMGWERELQELTVQAKKEGKVSVYSTIGSEPRIALTDSFQRRFNIALEFITAKGAEVSQRLLSERKAGIYLVDIYMGGPTTLVNELKPSMVFDPLPTVIFLPEVLDTKLWLGAELPYLDKDKVALSFAAYPSPSIAINTELVKEGEIKSYRDLLNPKWRGKITINDPTVAGSGDTWFSTVGTKIMDFDYMQELAKQMPTIIRDQRQQVDWLARGKFPIAIAPKPEEMGEFARAGAPIKNLAPVEGMYLTMGSGNIALINKVPHPKAAKLFINWFLTREGQTIYSKSMNVQSAREDVPTDHLDPVRVRQPGVKYASMDDEDFLLSKPKIREKAREIFGPFIK